MKKFTAQFLAPNGYGNCICTADTIRELYEILRKRGFKYAENSFADALLFERTDKKKFYGRNIEIRRGELEMTEYTSL